MTISTRTCNIFKYQVFLGNHNILMNNFKIAFYDSNATLNETTIEYTVDNEIQGTGYVAGGYDMTWSMTWDTETNKWDIKLSNLEVDNLITNDLQGALLYNASLPENNAVCTWHLPHAIVNGSFDADFNHIDLWSI